MRLTVACQSAEIENIAPHASTELRPRAHRSSHSPLQIRFAVQSAQLPQARDAAKSSSSASALAGLRLATDATNSARVALNLWSSVTSAAHDCNRL